MCGRKGLLLSSTVALVVCAAGIAAAQQPAETTIPEKVRLFIPYKDYTPGGQQADSRDVQVAPRR